MAILNTANDQHIDFSIDKYGSISEFLESNVSDIAYSQPYTATSSNTVLSEIAFLQSYLSFLHSIVVIGSTAQGTRTKGSDLDIVVICKNNCLEDICVAIFENNIEKNLSGAEGANLEISVLTQSQAEA